MSPSLVVGTSPAYFVPRSETLTVIEPAQGYFMVKIASAQARFEGSIWTRADRLVVTSQVDLHHTEFGGPLKAIQRVREVKRQRAEQLGLAPTLVHLVPTTMDRISLSVDFLLDQENRFATLARLINDDAFVASIGLSPAFAVAAKTVGSISQRLLDAFYPGESQRPILQFAADFHLATRELMDGYYIVLGTRDENTPLPENPPLTVRDGLPVIDGEPVTEWSYVVFDVRGVPLRTRDLNNGAPWDKKFREALAKAADIGSDPFAPEDDIRRAWVEIRRLLDAGRALLASDPNYLRKEADLIAAAATEECLREIEAPRSTRMAIAEAGEGAPSQDHSTVFRVPVVDLAEAGLDRDALRLYASEYRESSASARVLLGQAGVFSP